MAHLKDTGHNYQRPSATNGASQINGDVYFTPGQDALNQLPVVHEASHDSAEKQDDPLCLENTRAQVQECIYSWQESDGDNRCIFWLSGMAGTGKSTIARTVAHEFQRRKCLVASFFFSRGSGDSESASFLFTSLAKQLATRRGTATQATSSAHVALQDALRETLRQDPDVIRKSRQEQWNELIIRPLSSFFAKLQDVSPTTSAVLVIDALDECSNENDIKGIIRTMARQQLPQARLRIIITSRPETLVRLEFSDKRNILHSSLSLDDVPQHVIDADLARFLHSRFDAIRDCQEGSTEDWPGLHTLDVLLRRCGGLFIYAETLCLYLEEDCQHSQSRLQAVLNETTSQVAGHATALDEIYLTVLINAFQNLSKLSDREKERSRNLYDHIIGSIVVSQENLSVDTLACLTQVAQFDIMALLHKLRSIIKYSEAGSPITLLHETFREFISDRQRCKDTHLTIDMEAAHSIMLDDCLQVLRCHLKPDICGLQDPGIAVDDQRVNRAKLSGALSSHVQYAAHHWFTHLMRSGMGELNIRKIDSFLRRHLLHWVEVLSWLGKYTKAVESVSTLFETLVEALEKDLKAFCWDARRFLIQSGVVIANYPLQMYCSALLVSPRASLVYKTFSKEMPAWLSRYCSPCAQWDPYVLTLPTSGNLEQSFHFAFSSDSSCIALLSENDDGESHLDVWSLKCGSLLTSLVMPGPTFHVQFSPDGNFLAFTVTRTRIRIYNLATRTTGYRLDGHGDAFETMQFSPDSTHLVSVSDKHEVSVWSVDTGKLRWRFVNGAEVLRSNSSALQYESESQSGHSVTPTVAFSNDGSLIASAFSSNMITIWDVATGSLQFQTRLDNDGKSITLCFSSHNNLIVAKGEEMIFWEPKTRLAHRKKLRIRIFKEQPNSAATCVHWLSPDGSILATYQDTGMISFCNTTNGECFNQIFHRHLPIWLQFCSSSHRVVLRSEYGIGIYDLVSTSDVPPFTFYERLIGEVAVSPDGKMLAEAGAYTRIRDLSSSPSSPPDPGSGLHVCPQRPQLSVDGTQVLYVKEAVQHSTKLLFWDNLMDSLFSIETFHSDFLIEKIDVSADKSYVIARVRDQSAKGSAYLYSLLDHSTKTCMNLAGPTAFSNSSDLLALACPDFSIQIWDLQSRQCKAILEGHFGEISKLKFSSSDLRLASTDSSGKIIVWEHLSSSMEAVFSIRLGPGRISHLTEIAFSKDESLLACTWGHSSAVYGCEDVYLWDLRTKTQLQTFQTDHHFGRARMLSFSDEGRYLRTASSSIDLMASMLPCLDLGRALDVETQSGWIEWHGRKVLWQPDQHNGEDHDTWCNRLALAHKAGGIMFVEFDPQALQEALGI